MFITEIVASKNICKTKLYKIVNAGVIIIVLVFVAISLNVFGKESPITIFYRENYGTIIQPIFLGVFVIAIAFSMYAKVLMQKLNRLGTLEMNNHEIKFLVEEEVKETISVDELTAVELEFFSMRTRNNQYGCMNYLTLHSPKGIETYEIIIGNSLEKSELGNILRSYKKRMPVKITYSLFIKRIIGDRDFKF